MFSSDVCNCLSVSSAADSSLVRHPAICFSWCVAVSVNVCVTLLQFAILFLEPGCQVVPSGQLFDSALNTLACLLVNDPTPHHQVYLHLCCCLYGNQPPKQKTFSPLRLLARDKSHSSRSSLQGCSSYVQN